MKAVVMAGGEGSRLRPLTISRPKPMVPIVGRPVAEHILNLLKEHGITDVIMTVQYLASNIEDYFGDGAQFGMRIRYSREESPLGTAGSVKNAESWLRDEPFLVISGDALTDYNLSKIIEFHREKQAMATLTLAHVANPLEYGVIITDDEGHITQFLEKPSWAQVFSDTINTGIYMLDPKIFDYFERDTVFDFSNDLFPILLKQGDPLYGYIADGYWCDVGNLSEYMRANADALQGHVQIKIPGHNIGGDIWTEQGVEIAENAQLFGPIYLGQSARVLPGAQIHGPCVIGNYSIIDAHAKVDRSVIWNSSYIGEFAELRGAIAGSHTSIKTKAVLFEGSVVGDDCLIDESAIIQPGVKLWPKKAIENGAVVTSSIIWGNQGRRTLFGRFGVTGLVNIDITPELAAKLGAAYGATLKKGTRVCVNRDAHRTPRMIKRAMISGLPSAGINVHDLETVPLPVARYYVRTTDAVGGVHIRLAPNDPRTIDIKFLDQNGMDISKATERKIENMYFREDFRRVYLDEIGDISYAPNVIDRYRDAYLKALDVKSIRVRPYQLVADYGHGSGVTVLAPIFNQLGCEVIAINSTMDETRYSRSIDDIVRDRQRLADITKTLDAHLGISLDTSCEKLFVVDEQGRLLDNNELLAVMTDLLLRANPGATVVVPVTASGMVEQVAQRTNGTVKRVGVSPQVLTSSATQSGVVLVGDALGGFVFPSLHPAFDALFSLAKLLELLAKFDVKLSTLVNDLPTFFQVRKFVDCPWEYKGKVMRLLSENYRDSHAPDGVRIQSGKNDWVLVLPDADRPVFTIFAEARSHDQAQALADRYARVVASFQQ
jgi:mannose-1-phosphate guanylyltransferase/phosphomannomutase